MRKDEVDEEGMAEADTAVAIEAEAMAGGPMDAVLRPMARLLTGPRPEGANTVDEPTVEA